MSYTNSNIITFDWSDFEDFFGGNTRKQPSRKNTTLSTNFKSYKYEKTEGGHSLEVPVVGLTKEDISVKVVESNLNVKNKLDGNYWTSKFDLSFSIPTNSDVENIKAEVNNGLLKVFIPFNENFEKEVKIN